MIRRKSRAEDATHYVMVINCLFKNLRCLRSNQFIGKYAAVIIYSLRLKDDSLCKNKNKNVR